MAKQSMTEYMQRRTAMQRRGDDPTKPKTLSLGSSNANEGRFEKREGKSASEMRDDRRALAKDLRTGKIDKKTYDSKVGATRTEEDKQNLKKNAGGSGVKAKKGGSAMKAETRSRVCSKPGKGF